MKSERTFPVVINGLHVGQRTTISPVSSVDVVNALLTEIILIVYSNIKVYKGDIL
jgi:hypothetical protein